MDNAKIMIGNKPDQSPSPLNLNKQGSQVVGEKSQQKTSTISSKFRARMEKLNKQTKSKEMYNLQSDGNSNVDVKVE